MKISTSGFTIVELLIVVVVVGIVATISVTTYIGIPSLARDSERKQEIEAIQKALELYNVYNGGYPLCNSGTYVPGGSPAYEFGTVSACLTSKLVPTYMPAIPRDPINTGSNQYLYAVGFRKTGTNSFVVSPTHNYILGNKLEVSGGPTYTGWGATDLNYLIGN